MKTLCISGAQSIEFDHVSAMLLGAGIEQAKPVERETTIGMAEWHQNTEASLKQKKTPGRLWEQLAGDLILANLHYAQWGWADTKNLEALEFWAQLEPSISFLLLTSDPQDYLAQRLLNDSNEQGKDEQAYLKQWQAEHEQLLAFYLANADSCLLVNAGQAAANPKALTEKLAERWHFQLNVENTHLPTLADSAAQTAPITLARYIAKQTMQEHGKSLSSLKDELNAAQYPLAEPEAVADAEGNWLSTAEISLTTLLKDYKRRCEQDLHESERQDFSKLKQDLKEAQRLPSSESPALEETKQENELLMLQLHQVQEELEHYFLQHQKTSDETTQLKQENRKLKQKYKLAKEQASAPKGLFARKPKKATPQLEFEGIQLRNEQVNPDYEHLWISLQSPSFGERLADQWHFRISCAGVKPGEFGQHPKLELPEQSDQLLTNWFAESESEHGRKLELRFALPNAMDTGVWKKIQADDQQLLKALCQQLPEIVAALKKQNTYISRDWTDWEALAVNMKRIHQSKASK